MKSSSFIQKYGGEKSRIKFGGEKSRFSCNLICTNDLYVINLGLILSIKKKIEFKKINTYSSIVHTGM